mmetsp:Transcript_27405/g.50416  ORF Transcript_27405/g.50416 Transcript_27405/m.50416 type:complete len:213 (+) Transcript_27405:1007-1645(+)
MDILHVTKPGIIPQLRFPRANFAQGHRDIRLIRQKICKPFIRVTCKEIKSRQPLLRAWLSQVICEPMNRLARTCYKIAFTECKSLKQRRHQHLSHGGRTGNCHFRDVVDKIGASRPLAPHAGPIHSQLAIYGFHPVEFAVKSQQSTRNLDLSVVRFQKHILSQARRHSNQNEKCGANRRTKLQHDDVLAASLILRDCQVFHQVFQHQKFTNS